MWGSKYFGGGGRMRFGSSGRGRAMISPLVLWHTITGWLQGAQLAPPVCDWVCYDDVSSFWITAVVSLFSDKERFLRGKKDWETKIKVISQLKGTTDVVIEYVINWVSSKKDFNWCDHKTSTRLTWRIVFIYAHEVLWLELSGALTSLQQHPQLLWTLPYPYAYIRVTAENDVSVLALKVWESSCKLFDSKLICWLRMVEP